MPQIVINNSKNQDDVIYDLRKNSNVKNQAIVPFIGAGPSMILGLPSWSQLVKEYAELVGYPHDINTQFTTFGRSWAKVAEEIYQFSGGDIEAYRTHMSEMHPTEAEWTNFHFLLVKHFKRIVTTNYDYALENAYRECHRMSTNPEPNLLYFPTTLNAINFTEGTIAYLHGQIHVRDFVFRESEYQHAYVQHKRIANFLSQVIELYQLLFIGFSFDDPIFRDAIRAIFQARKSESESVNNVFGADHVSESPKSYIILSYQDIETTFTRKAISAFGIGLAAQNQYFTLRPDDTFDLTNEVDIEQEPFFLQEDFKKEYSRLKFNVERLNYLNSLDFGILLYNSKNRTEIVTLLNKISRPETQATEDLPDFSITAI